MRVLLYALLLTPLCTAQTPLALSTNSLSFSEFVNGDDPQAEIVAVTGTVNHMTKFTVQVDAGPNGGAAPGSAPGWLSVFPLSGTTPAILTVGADTAALAAGTHTARIRVIPVDAPQTPSDV